MTTDSKPINPVLIVAAIALIVFCAAGVAAIMGWIPSSVGGGAAPQQLQAPEPMSSNAPPPVAYAAAPPAPAEASYAAPVRARCGDCGVVESVREVQRPGHATGIGAVGGAVAGGVLGHEVGGGRGRDVMTLVGAVAGGVAGNHIEKKVRTTRGYQVTVRMEDGSTRVSNVSAPPSWRAGDRVRLIDGRLQPDNA